MALCLSVFAAPSPATEKGASEISVVPYPPLRVGDLAPTWSFTGADGIKWSSRDFLGKRSLYMVVDSGYPVWPFTPESANVAKRIKPDSALLVVAATSRSAIGGMDKTNKVLVMPISPEQVQPIFPVGSKISIDRAGFIRRAGTWFEDETAKTFDASTGQVPVDEALPQIAVGQPAPDFAMIDMHGRLRHLADMKGRKNVLLTFFTKCFTEGCTTHLGSLRDSYPAFVKNDTEVWAVSVDAGDGAQGQRAFADKLKLPFPLIPDTGRNLSLLYGAVTSANGTDARMSVLVDKTGTIRIVDTAIRTETHGADILARMETLGLLGPGAATAPAAAPFPKMATPDMGGDVAH